MAEQLSIVPKPLAAASPTMRDLLAVLFRQRRMAIWCFVSVWLVVMLYGLLAPSYEARMRVLVRRGRLDPVITPTPTQSLLFLRDEVTEEELNSEVELLRDDEILRNVVRDARLMTADPWWLGILDSSEEVQLEKAVRQAGRRLKVDPIRKTNLIELTYSSSDPEQAANVLRCLEHVYLERHERVRRPSGQFSFFAQQVAQSRRGLLEAEARLMDFTREQGVVSATTERDTALQKLSEAEANDRQTRVAIAETAQRLRALEAKLNSLPERVTTMVRSSDNPQLLQSMKSRLLELELKRTELLTKFEPSYRLVQEVDQEIAKTKASLAAEEQAPLREQTTDQNPNREWTKGELIKAQVEVSALEAHAQATGIEVARYREIAYQLGDRAIKQEELMRELKMAEEKYVLYVNKLEEARIGDALDQGGILNVTIAEQPTVPALPARSELSFGVIGVFMAGTLSAGLAFASDHLDPTFRTSDEVIAFLGTPVLAALPPRNT